jgi:hypothetical protein
VAFVVTGELQVVGWLGVRARRARKVSWNKASGWGQYLLGVRRHWTKVGGWLIIRGPRSTDRGWHFSRGLSKVIKTPPWGSAHLKHVQVGKTSHVRAA